MTKDEALKLALEALEADPAEMVEDENGHMVFRRIQAIITLREALAQPEPNYKKALEVWLDKTEWVQETVKPHELGMHRADVLKQRIEEASPQRTWVGLTDEEIRLQWSAFWEAECHPWAIDFAQAIEAKLRSKNNG
jgi:hypothetical protein